MYCGRASEAFAPAVAAAIQGESAVRHLDAFACCEILQSLSGVPIPPQVEKLKELPVLHSAVCDKTAQGMADAVKEAFGMTK